jgi:nitric oxide reductase NorQ protein
MENDTMEKQFIESIKPTQDKPLSRTYKVPTAEIDYKSYLPVKWGVEYIQLSDEADELEACLLKGMNYLIEGDKGIGKTQLVHNLCLKHSLPIIPINCSEGTKIGDLIGRPQINEFGSYFQLGVLPTAIEVANKSDKKIAVLYMDEFNAMRHEIQKATNSVTDDRKSIVANGKTYKLDEGVKLSVIATINPSTYAGVNTLTEDAKSRFIGATWEYPSSEDIERILDWSSIPVQEVKEPMLTLVQNIHNLRINADVEYSLSPRDVAQFTNCYRMWSDSALDKPLERSLKNAVVSKFGDTTQRELIKKQITEIFGVSV